MKNFSLKRVAIAIAVVLLIAGSPWLFTFGLISSIEISQWLKVRKFDAELWKNPQRKQERVYMVRDLIGKHKLEGMTKAEVLNLLGQADSERDGDPSSIMYRLGPQRGFIRIDDAWLSLDINSEGLVVKARHWGD
jgi:hypothetical protein